MLLDPNPKGVTKMAQGQIAAKANKHAKRDGCFIEKHDAAKSSGSGSNSKAGNKGSANGSSISPKSESGKSPASSGGSKDTSNKNPRGNPEELRLISR
jgi:hypothetical protein